jgi:hypothetical protein
MEPVIVATEEEVISLKRRKIDPIIHRESAHEVCVHAHRAYVWHIIKTGNNWHMGVEERDRYGYRKYVFTRLNEAQLVEHLMNPTVHQGKDD